MQLFVLSCLLGSSIAVSVHSGLTAAVKSGAKIYKDTSEKDKGESEQLSGAGVFAFHLDPRGSDILTKVSYQSQPASLTLEQQKTGWYPTHESSPLSKFGFSKWTPTESGLRFSDEDNTKSMNCATPNGRQNDKKDSVLLAFHCEIEGMGMEGGADEERFKGKVEADCPFWNSCSNAPYDLGSVWGPWVKSYPYYACTPSGYYGCSVLTGTACTGSMALYPYGSFSRLDLQPNPFTFNMQTSTIIPGSNQMNGYTSNHAVVPGQPNTITSNGVTHH